MQSKLCGCHWVPVSFLAMCSKDYSILRGKSERYVIPNSPCLMYTDHMCIQVYWRIYNALDLGAADALVPFYPDLGDLTDERNVYDRHPLQIWI